MNRVIIIGAGKGGGDLLKLFLEAPTVKVVEVADRDEHAVGLVVAKNMGIPVSTDFRELITNTEAELIIDATGETGVSKEIFESNVLREITKQ